MTNTQAATPKPATVNRAAKMANTQSINHLLNFTLPPRQAPQYQSLPRRRKTGTQHNVWNKERFVNAQYRFVMNPSGDYTVHFADPDIFFQWHDILQVIVPRSSASASATGSGAIGNHDEGITTCPICLSPPTAPRMTKCGHVFCFPCILHLINTSESLKWVRCPICFDSVNERQLKSVKWLDVSEITDDDEDTPAEASSSSATADNANTPRPGSTLRMRLIQRPQITTLALPRSSTWPSDLLLPLQAPFHFQPDVYSFAKFMLATPEYLVDNLTKELDDLNLERRLLAGMNDDLGVSFVDAADAKLRHQIEKAMALDTPQLKETIEQAIQTQQRITNRVVYHNSRAEEYVRVAPLADAPEAFLATQTPGISTPTFSPRMASSAAPTTPNERAPTPSRNPRQRRNLNPPPPSTSTYYYYQAASGMPIFLHPLDIKILLSHFTSYASFPDIITVRVESHAESTMNEDLRKRCKYLAHLPEGADVVFVETDLEGVVGQDGLKNFERALSMRRARRKEKGRKDDKARAKAEEKEKEKLVNTWNEVHRTHVDAYIAPPVPRPASPVEFEEFHEEETVASFQPQPNVQGAWGSRSFASAANSSQGRPLGQRSTRRAAAATAATERESDEYDWDVAFHELEQRGARGGGSKKKNSRMVVLGGGGGGGRRR